MIYRFTSSKVVYARVQRYVIGSAWLGTGMLWLGDGIQKLGYASKRKNLVESKALVIANHKVEIPCDVEFIEKVIHVESGCRLMINKDSSMLALSCDDYIFSKQNIGEWYDVNPPYIRTSFESGTIDLFYRSYEMDEEGFLLIPDVAEYREALVWNVLKNLILEGYKLKDPRIDFVFAEEMWEKYKHSAKGKVRRFSRDERERFARMWNSLNTSFIDHSLMDVQ